MHGGKTPSGLASPHLKHGRYSKHLPARLVERYEEAKADGDLVALRDEIALVETRIAELLTRVDSGETKLLWSEARQTMKRLSIAVRAQDGAAMSQLLAHMDDLTRRGDEDFGVWDELQKSLDLKRKLAESEQKRLVAMNQTITVERAMLMMGAVSSIIREEVKDRATLQRVSDRLRDIMAAQGTRDAGG
ncbi:MAG: hypothetical protein AAGK74_00040 [Chloroflexota bacterium]